MYNALRTGNEDNTYIIMTDGSHNCSSDDDQYQEFHARFKAMVYSEGPKITENRPTVQALREQIVDTSFLGEFFNDAFKRK
jgi:hypothetical protein